MNKTLPSGVDIVVAIRRSPVAFWWQSRLDGRVPARQDDVRPAERGGGGAGASRTEAAAWFALQQRGMALVDEQTLFFCTSFPSESARCGAAATGRCGECRSARRWRSERTHVSDAVASADRR